MLTPGGADKGGPHAQCWNGESKRFMGKVMEISGLGQSTFLPDGARRGFLSSMPLQTLQH